MGASITGVGVFLPEKVLTNAELEQRMDTTDEWITSRTGIKERRILSPETGMVASDMGAAAALKALEKAGISVDEVDGIIVGAINPDKQFPATACFIQAKIGAKNAFAYDLTAACAGFVYGLNMAALLVDSGQCRNVLVIGAELLSPVVDWTDRNTCILFGDAAGAAVVSATPEPGRGILKSFLKSDGTQAGLLYLESLVLKSEDKKNIHMDGKQVFKLAVSEVSAIVKEAVTKSGYQVEDVDMLILHQANRRIIAAIGEKLGLPPEKVFINVQKFGNTSSASIPLALNDALEAGLIRRGSLVALAAVGGGMSWGCNIVRW